VLVVTVFFWFGGPIGTYEGMQPLFRGVYWGGLIFGAVPFAYAFRKMITRALPDLSIWPQAGIVAAGFSFAYTPVVFLATYWAAHLGLAQMAPLELIWGGTFLAAGCAYAVRTLVLSENADETAPSETPEEVERPACRLMLRIDPALRGPLISISVRDHYVDVRTRSGQASLLMRLSDAISETEGVDGAQVHRSHWIAWDAVEGVEREGGNLVLRMAQGARIPVSRLHRAKVEQRRSA